MSAQLTQLWVGAMTVALGVLLMWGSVASAQQQGQDVQIRVLSGRAELVSGGDALVEVTLPPNASAADASITVDGRDVKAAFRGGDSAGSLVGLVDGLRVGRSVLRVTSGAATGQLELVNYPITGPILSGPHMAPFVCMTEESGLGAPLDENCSAPARVDYFYRTRGFGGGQFKALADPTARPNDLAETTTRDGRQVPYIVRVESGTINRSIYRIAILDDPQQASSEPWTPGSGWNRRIVMTFGPGCNTSYNQGRNTTQTVLSDLYLSRGFAHMVSSLNVLGLQCNDHLSGETFMMLKEHFIEQYGVPMWTAGMGGSGGAIQQALIAQNFPGLLDGLMTTRAFPDLMSMWSAIADCRLLGEYFGSAAWSADKRQAVEGMSSGTCTAIDRYVETTVATRGCNISEDLVYDPISNPTGARCTVWDTNVSTYGRDPATGTARRTYDNIGIQFGLEALNDGVISKAEFLDLNARVGGYDNDGNMRPERTAADLEAVRLAYAAGRVNTAGGSLGSIPIISFRAYLDDAADVHDRVRDMILRLRLDRAHGRSDNFVTWLSPNGPMLTVQQQLAVETMSAWLDALVEDTSGDPEIEKVVRAKPARAVDACWDYDATRIDEPFTFDDPGSRCNAIFPVHSNTRMVAGEPRTADVMKCQLRPASRADYQVSFADTEWEELTRVFPSGVYDYSKPGVNQGPVKGVFQSLPLSPPSTATE